MTCENTVRTKSGVFTFHAASVTKCEAENRCLKMGQILAPVTNRKDANKLLKLFAKNNSTCQYSQSPVFAWRQYWLGLDVTQTRAKQEKVFSNGEKWVERKHGKIYKDLVAEYTDDGYTDDGYCPEVTFEPSDENYPFAITNGLCGSKKSGYICLKPHGKELACSEKSVASGKASAEAVVQKNDGVFVPFGSAVFAVSMLALCVCVAVRRQQRLKKENDILKLKLSRNEKPGNNELNGISLD